jgi:sulfur relay protein TusB/DsrH
MISLVYLYGYNIRDTARFENLLQIIKEQIKLGAILKIILIHDGVIGTSKKGKIPPVLDEIMHLPMEVYAMKPDLIARGIDLNSIYEKIHIIEYEQLVDILVETSKIVSWL